MEWNSTDLDDLTNAVGLLENPGLIAKVSDVVGTPIEYVLKTLPKGAGDKITKVTHDSLMAAVNLAVKTIDPRGRRKPRSRSHQALAGLAGGVWRKIVMEHEMLLVFALNRVNDLLVARRSQCCNHHSLGLATREQRRSMCTR